MYKPVCGKYKGSGNPTPAHIGYIMLPIIDQMIDVAATLEKRDL